MASPALDVRSVFERALEFSCHTERDAYIGAVCADDPGLWDKVQALLNAHADVGSFLNQPPPGVERTQSFAPIAERPGAHVGRYKLLEQIGEGGFGVVFMAEQEQPVRRRVALKVIKPGMDTRQVIARFEAERQALALMEHPNIAHVLDAGATDSGRPYFVMELVRGVSLTDYCDNNCLTVSERLKLFSTVCLAVQHAHQKGIIHRDIKPSNVLVTLHDGVPVIKVIDFGVAKATGQRLTDKTLFTGFAQMLGTPLYMSPEQAEMSGLDVDTRSDIYSLGVLLYELLTGATPFDQARLQQAGYDEMRRIIREEEPLRPSTRFSTMGAAATTVSTHRKSDPKKLGQLIRGELDWIVMKCLDKDRNRRYETANSLIRDLERYLCDEPVQACPPSASYRFRKLLRRNKGAVAAAALVFVTLVAGVIGTTAGLVEARRQRDLARNAAEAEGAANKASQTRESELRAVLDFVQRRVFAAARPEGVGGGLGKDVTLGDAVEAALPFLTTSFEKQPVIEGRLRMTLGESFLYLGKAQLATDQFEAAHKIFTKHFGPHSPETLVNMSNLARGYAGLGRYEEANALFIETLSKYKTSLGKDHPNTLRAMSDVAIVYSELGRNADAVQLLEEALVVQRENPVHDDGGMLKTMLSLAYAYQAMGRHAEALQLGQQTLALSRTTLGRDQPETLIIMAVVADSLVNIGQFEKALALLEETLAIEKTRLGRDHPNTINTMRRLAGIYGSNLDRYAEAAQLLEEALELYKIRLGLNHPSTRGCMSQLASCYQSLGRDADAQALLQDVYARQIANREAKQGAATNDELARTYRALGRPDDAQDLYEAALAENTAMFGADDANRVVSLRQLAALFASQGRWKEAANAFSDAYALVPTDHSLILSAASAALAAEEDDLYRRVCDRALKQFADTNDPVAADRTAKAGLLAPPPPELLSQFAHLAEVAAESDPNHAWINYFQMVRGIAAYRVGDWKGTLQWCGRSRQLSDFLPNQSLNFLFEAMAHHRLNQTEQAREAMQRAMSILNEHLPRLEGDWGDDWSDWLICTIVRREAELLLREE